MVHAEGRAAPRFGFAGVAFRPALLLLAPLLATMPIFVPNIRIVRDLSQAPLSFGNIATGMMAACLAATAVFLACVFSGRRWKAPRAGALWAVPAMYGAAQVTMWVTTLAWHEAPGGVLFGIGAVLGVCLVPLLLMWSSCYALDFRSVLLHGALSCLVSIALVEAVALLPVVSAAVVWCACAFAGAAASVVLQGKSVLVSAPAADGAGGTPAVFGEVAGADAPSARAAIADFLKTMWLPLLGLVVCVTCSCMAETTIDGRVAHGEYVGLAVASAVAAALALVRFATPLVMRIDLLVVPVLIACSLVLRAVLGEGTAGTLLGANLVFVPTMFISLYAMASLIALRGFSRLLVAGVTLAVCCLAMIAGSVLNVLLAETRDTGPAVNVATTVYYAAVLCHLGFTMWRTLTGRGGEASPAGRAMVETARARRCDELAARFALTGREREILEYLGRGYNSGYIAQALLISGNTVRTHMRNMYRKMGVSSHAELLSLFNES